MIVPLFSCSFWRGDNLSFVIEEHRKALVVMSIIKISPVAVLIDGRNLPVYGGREGDAVRAQQAHPSSKAQ